MWNHVSNHSSIVSRGLHMFLHEPVLSADGVGGGVVSHTLDHELVCACACVRACVCFWSGGERSSWEPVHCLEEGGSGGCDEVTLCGRGAASADMTAKWKKRWGKNISITPWLLRNKPRERWVFFALALLNAHSPLSQCAIVAIFRNIVNC